MAAAIGISVDVLEACYPKELSGSAMRANINVMQTLYQMAISGKDFGATKFWMKNRMGWGKKPEKPSPPAQLSGDKIDLFLDKIEERLSKADARIESSDIIEMED